MKILIVTTALNRSGLHNEVLNSYKKFINKTDEITWLIHIDKIEALNEDIRKTERNIRSIFKRYNNIKFHFLKNNDGRGYFNKAVRKLLTKAKEFIDDVDYVMYLEDDYKVHDNLEKIEYNSILESFGDVSNDNMIITLASSRSRNRRGAFTFPPQIWSRSMFKMFINVFDKIDDPDNCPEWLLNTYFDKVNNKPKLYYNQIPSFHGARLGRKWLSEQGLVKVGNFYEKREVVDLERNRMLYLGKEFNSDKITNHHYYKYYDRYLKDFYDAQGCLLEVGVAKGNSIQMWQKVFPNMFIYGADIVNSKFKIDNKRYKFINCDQSSDEDLDKLLEAITRPLYIVIDDGSHIPEDQLKTFNKVFPKLYNKGIYIIEDIETSYWRKGSYMGHKMDYGKDSERSIVNLFKNAVHCVNSHIVGTDSDYPVKHLDQIESISFAKNCIIIKKDSRKYKDIYKYKSRV